MLDTSWRTFYLSSNPLPPLPLSLRQESARTERCPVSVSGPQEGRTGNHSREQEMRTALHYPDSPFLPPDSCALPRDGAGGLPLGRFSLGEEPLSRQQRRRRQRPRRGHSGRGGAAGARDVTRRGAVAAVTRARPALSAASAGRPRCR